MNPLIATVTPMMWARVVGWLALTALGLWVRSYYRKKEKQELARSAGTFEAAAEIKARYRALESCGLVVALIAAARLVVLFLARD